MILAVTTDGRPHLADTIASARTNLPLHQFTQRWIIDDTGDPVHRRTLTHTYPVFDIVAFSPIRRGQDHQLRSLWWRLATDEPAWVFHLEDDFTFNHPVDLDGMLHIAQQPTIAQVALLRQPWFRRELQAGGIYQANPDEYTEHTDGPHHWVEHRRWFTLNPCLYHTRITRHEWPTGPKHEWRQSRHLADLGYRFAYHGRLTDPPAVTHHGSTRNGHGY